MNAIAEIDKTGRIVVPKKMRDALHLVAGTQVEFDQRPDGIMLRTYPKARGLYMRDGMPVFSMGGPLPANCVDWVEQARDARAEEIMGPWEE